MKNFIHLFVIVTIATSLNLNAQLSAKVYEDPNCKDLVENHKSIAILPLDVIMSDTRSNEKKRSSVSDLAQQATEYQRAFQNSMYAWFLKRKQKKKMIDVEIQDVEKTNTLLIKNGIRTKEDLMEYTKEEIAEILNVDAVFGGSVKTNRSMSKGGAFVISALTGFYLKTGDADVFIKLYDGESGKMIWSFSRVVASSYTNSTDDVVNYLMKRISKRFPYEK